MRFHRSALGSLLVACMALVGCGSTVPGGGPDPGGPQARAGDTVLLGPLEADVASAAGFHLTPLISSQNAVFAYTAMWGSEITRLQQIEPRGIIAYSSSASGNYEIYAINEDGTQITQIIDASGSTENEPSWSPDASQITYSTSQGGDYEIAVANADGSGRTTITNNSYSDIRPAWSPDGDWIAYGSNSDGDNEIYLRRPDGTSRTQLTENTDGDYEPKWSPDGQWIAWYSDADGDNEIYKMRADGSNQTQLTDNTDDDTDPVWSPDGGSIAFATTRDGNYNIYSMDIDGSNPTQLTDDPGADTEPSYSPDGDMIAFESDRDGDDEVFVMSAAGSGETQLTFNSVPDVDPSWSPAPVVRRVYIGAAGADGGEDPPFNPSRPLAVVGIGPPGSGIPVASVVMSSSDWPSLSVSALEGTGLYLAGMTMTGDEIKAVIEDRGRGLPFRKWQLRETPDTTFAIVHFDAMSGGIRSIIAGADQALATSAVPGDAVATMTAQGIAIRGEFTEAYDARDPAHNLIGGVANEVLLEARTGDVLAVN